MVQLTQTLAFALLAATSIAHPGASIKKDILRRQAHFDHPEYRSLNHCKKDLEASGWIQSQAERRHEKINMLRAERGYKPLARRDPAQDIEAFGQACSTVLDPEVTEGPYCAFSCPEFLSLTDAFSTRGLWRIDSKQRHSRPEGCPHLLGHQRCRCDDLQACYKCLR